MLLTLTTPAALARPPRMPYGPPTPPRWVQAPPIIYEPALAAPAVVRPPVVAQPEPVAVSTGHSVRGEVSWYCKAGVSICTHGYPPGSMVGAACGRLRSAMGPNWRGKSVRVTNSAGNTVVVVLVDWCGNRSRLIDLYWVAIHRLGGTGVLDVTVSW